MSDKDQNNAPLSSEERRELEELRLAKRLSERAQRAVAADLQRHMKFQREQRPSVELVADDTQPGGCRLKLLSAAKVGDKFYPASFSWDYLVIQRALHVLKETKAFMVPAIAGIGSVGREPQVGGMGWDLAQSITDLSALLQRFGVLPSHWTEGGDGLSDTLRGIPEKGELTLSDWAPTR